MERTMPDSIHNYHIDREREIFTDLVYSPDDGGWYGHQHDLKKHKTRNTKRVHAALSSLQFDMDRPKGLTGSNLWERWS